MPHRLPLALCLAASLALAACGSVYRMPGAESVPASQIAVLHEMKGQTESVGVTAIDGTSRGWGLFERFELVPGERTLTVQLFKGNTNSTPMKLRFRAEAGEHYELKYQIVPTGAMSGTWNARVVSRRDGKNVSEVVR